MIEPSRLRNVRQIVCHADCPDGIASAIVLRDALPGAEILFVQHGTPAYVELPARTNMLFCDIAPPRTRVAQFLECGAVVLDHHRTVKEDVLRFVEVGLGVFADEAKEPGVSGALLAYRNVWMPLCCGFISSAVCERAQDFAELAGVRDTWQKDDSRWEVACAQAEALRFYPFAFWPESPFSAAGNQRLTALLEVGPALVDRRRESARKEAERGWRFTTRSGTRVLIVSTRETSDVMEEVRETVDLVAGFSFLANNGREGREEKMICSTRSRGSFDCANFAERNGGGGHTRAAGFERTLLSDDVQPYTLLAGLIERHETTLRQEASSGAIMNLGGAR